VSDQETAKSIQKAALNNRFVVSKKIFFFSHSIIHTQNALSPLAFYITTKQLEKYFAIIEII
jgi:hypothetical protein